MIGRSSCFKAGRVELLTVSRRRQEFPLNLLARRHGLIEDFLGRTTLESCLDFQYEFTYWYYTNIRVEEDGKEGAGSTLRFRNRMCKWHEQQCWIWYAIWCWAFRGKRDPDVFISFMSECWKWDSDDRRNDYPEVWLWILSWPVNIRINNTIILERPVFLYPFPSRLITKSRL